MYETIVNYLNIKKDRLKVKDKEDTLDETCINCVHIEMALGGIF